MSDRRDFFSSLVFVLLCCAVAQDTNTSGTTTETSGLVYHFSCTSNEDCNNNGQCTRNGNCVCDYNFSGESCQYCAAGYGGESCSEYRGCEMEVSVAKRSWRPRENNTFNIWDISILGATENTVFNNVTVWLENAENVTKMWNLEKIGADSTNNRTLFKILTGNFTWISLGSPAGFVLASDDVIPRIYPNSCSFAGTVQTHDHIFVSGTGVYRDHAGEIMSPYSLRLSITKENLHYIGLSITPTNGSVIQDYGGMTYEYPYYYIHNKINQETYMTQRGLGALIIFIETANYTKVPETLSDKKTAIIATSIVGALLFIAAILFSALFIMTRTKWWQQKVHKHEKMEDKKIELGELRDENGAGAILTCTLGNPSSP